jgi:hypothetical protein
MSPVVKNLLLGAAAVVMLALAVYFFATRRPADAQYPTEYTESTVCLETKEEFPVTSKITERAPFVNPKTGRRTLYPWYFCNNCQYRFVPTAIPSSDGEAPRLPIAPTCPHCGAQSASSWDPSSPSQAKPAGTAPLPALPK